MNLIKKTEAWMPIVMSFSAFVLVIVYSTVFGVGQPEGAEGLPARIFQLLLLAQALIAVFFLIKWLFKKPKEAILIFLLQIFVALIAVGTVYF